MLYAARLKVFKIVCLLACGMFNRTFVKTQTNLRPSAMSLWLARLYCCADFHICYTLHRVYICPGFLFRLAAGFIHTVIHFNTVSLKPVRVRNRTVGMLAEWMKHKIPDHYFYPKMPPLKDTSISNTDC